MDFSSVKLESEGSDISRGPKFLGCWVKVQTLIHLNG